MRLDGQWKNPNHQIELTTTSPFICDEQSICGTSRFSGKSYHRQIKSNQLHFTIHPVLIGRAVRYTETYQLHFYCQSVKLRWSRPSMKHSNMWSIRWNCSESHNMDIVDEWKIFTDSIENIQHTVLHIPVKIFFSTNSHQFYFKGNCQPKKTYNKSLFSDVFDHFIKQ